VPVEHTVHTGHASAGQGHHVDAVNSTECGDRPGAKSVAQMPLTLEAWPRLKATASTPLVEFQEGIPVVSISVIATVRSQHIYLRFRAYCESGWDCVRLVNVNTDGDIQSTPCAQTHTPMDSATDINNVTCNGLGVWPSGRD
jgi:hypothetical protein